MNLTKEAFEKTSKKQAEVNEQKMVVNLSKEAFKEIEKKKVDSQEILNESITKVNENISAFINKVDSLVLTDSSKSLIEIKESLDSMTSKVSKSLEEIKEAIAVHSKKTWIFDVTYKQNGEINQVIVNTK